MKKMKSLNKYGITSEKKVHKGWEEHQRIMADKSPKAMEYKALLKTNFDHPMGYFSKWQYVFSSQKGNVSLIKLFDYYRLGEHLWEIFCLDSAGEDNKTPSTPAKKELEDIERFYKREDAIKRIVEILRTDIDGKK